MSVTSIQTTGTWLQLLETVDDDVGTAFAPAFLVKAAKVFSAYAGPSGIVNPGALGPILEKLGVYPPSQQDIQSALRVAQGGGEATAVANEVEFQLFAGVLLVLAEDSMSRNGRQAPKPRDTRVAASDVVWALCRASAPLVIREKVRGTSLPPRCQC